MLVMVVDNLQLSKDLEIWWWKKICVWISYNNNEFAINYTNSRCEYSLYNNYAIITT